ncbi:hypothetical protein [Myxococcus xanthus]|uniref:hypothetical protein n=1 Tax=Myxococcus xanthus TaxID=34 RepID=UPI00112E59DD|nr:hypothetical protein [Myxococcus xanthus]
MKQRSRNLKKSFSRLRPDAEHQCFDPDCLSRAAIVELQRKLLRAAAQRSAPPLRGKTRPNESWFLAEMSRPNGKGLEQFRPEREQVSSPLHIRMARAIGRAFSTTAGALMARGGHPTVQRATWMLDLLSMWVPKRLASEEIGDALERINAMSAAGRPFWFIYLKVATTSWWVTWHSVLHYAERIAGIIGKATGGKGE